MGPENLVLSDGTFGEGKEERDTQSYFFLRYGDSATVVYKVAVKDDKVYHGEGSQEIQNRSRCFHQRSGSSLTRRAAGVTSTFEE